MSTAITLKIALRALAANKARSGLTMLGIIIGVGAVVAMVSLGAGASQSVTSSIEGLGSNLITVVPGSGGSPGGARQALGSATSLTVADAEAIKRQIATAKRVSPEYTERTSSTSTHASPSRSRTARSSSTRRISTPRPCCGCWN